MRSVSHRFGVAPWLAIAALVAASVGAARTQMVDGDSLARLANASYVLYGNDPHLTAVGFVWGPLPSLLMLPFLTLRTVWPSIAVLGLGAALVSAACGLVSVFGFWRLLTMLTTERRVRVVLFAAFVVNPDLWFYTLNGLTEMLFLALLIWSTVFLFRWLRNSDDAGALGWAGALLGFGYLVRYEALGAAAAVAIAVGVASYRRAPKEIAAASAGANALVVVFPVMTSFVLFALSSWLIVGRPFEQFSSNYGNAAVVSQGTGSSGEVMWFLATSCALLAPTLFVGLAAAFWRPGTDDRWDIAVVCAPLAGVAGSAVILQLRGATILSLRYLITLIPLNLVVLALVSGRRRTVGWRTPLVMAAAVAVGVTTTTWAMQDDRLGRYEHQVFTMVGLRDRLDEREIQHLFDSDRRIAAFLDRLQLPAASVLVDTYLGFGIVLASENPDQFVKSPDREWLRVLDDPWGNGIQYVLVPPRRLRGTADAINLRFPHLYSHGARFAERVVQYASGARDIDRAWRVYRLHGPLFPAQNEPVP